MLQRGAQSRQTGLKGGEPVWLICEPQREEAGSKIVGGDRSK